MPAAAKRSANGRRPLSRVPPKPWAMTTHGRGASPSPVKCQAASRSPPEGKVTSAGEARPARPYGGGPRALPPRPPRQRHDLPLNRPPATSRQYLLAQLVLVHARVGLHRVPGAGVEVRDEAPLVGRDLALQLLRCG